MNKYENLAKAIYGIGKYTFVAVVVGQFVTDTIKWGYIIGGSIFTVLVFTGAYFINKKHK